MQAGGFGGPPQRPSLASLAGAAPRTVSPRSAGLMGMPGPGMPGMTGGLSAHVAGVVSGGLPGPPIAPGAFGMGGMPSGFPMLLHGHMGAGGFPPMDAGGLPNLRQAGMAVPGHGLVGPPVQVIGDPRHDAQWAHSTAPGISYEAAVEQTQAITFGAVMLLVLRVSSAVLTIVLLGSPSLGFLCAMIYIVAALGSLFGIVSLVRPPVVPKGCEFIPACAHAEFGCLSCPCVPWTLAGWGAVTAIISFVLTVVSGPGVQIVDALASMLSIAFGLSWLRRLSIQEGYVCCVPAPKTAPAELADDDQAEGAGSPKAAREAAVDAASPSAGRPTDAAAGSPTARATEGGSPPPPGQVGDPEGVPEGASAATAAGVAVLPPVPPPSGPLPSAVGATVAAAGADTGSSAAAAAEGAAAADLAQESRLDDVITPP
mmetsp:Transcript_62117/g.166919  ORF Transcript_62117/g.166919 Transcript_62117/m.166919 type:complete len:428 (+) Transcript_62117:1-1284(+)